MPGVGAMRLVLLAAGALALGGCQTPLMEELGSAGEHIDGGTASPIVALRDAVTRAGEALGPPDMSVVAQQAYGDRLAAEAFERLPRADDAELESHLTGMANRLAEQAAGPRFTYKVYLIEAKEPNAFTPGGGHIFVTTGLVSRLGNEAQMAMVLAHEVAHSASGHVVASAHRRDLGRRAASASRTVLGEGFGVDWIGRGLGMAANAAANLYTRDQEDEADELGLDYMAAAGYDAREAEGALVALLGDGEEGGLLGERLFAGHSSKERRMQRLRNLHVAKYRQQDFSLATRTTLAYERVTARHRAQP